MTIDSVLRDSATADFLDATKLGKFLIKSCRGCNQKLSPKSVICTECHSVELEWIDASGLGSIVSWTVIPGRVFTTVTTQQVVFGIVELEEGPWWWAQLQIEPTEIYVGKTVKAKFVPSPEGEMIPVFVEK